jgi:hypothetical protein
MAKDGFEQRADDQSVAECQTCGGSFDECAYQVVIWGLGSFDSVECAERALHRRARRAAAAEGFEEALQPTTPGASPRSALDNGDGS